MIMELSDAYVTNPVLQIQKDDITNQLSNLSKSHNEIQHIFLPANDDAMIQYDNFSHLNFDEPKEFIFDRVYVRVLFITLYSIVFCCCFFGNLLVILVVTLSRRLRSITNFFLANLAVADFCVGIFCVFQNLSIYLIPSWVFGDFLCKMYQFVHSLSGTASIFILVVICTERYFAIIHPIKCKQILTTNRLRFVIAIVWILAAAYSTPRFIFVNTIEVPVGNETEIICISNRKMYNSELFDIINFGMLYVIPLGIMSILYSRIAISLWKSSTSFGRSLPLRNTTSSNNAQTYDKRILGPTESQVSMDSDKNYVSNQRNYQMVEQNAAQSLQCQGKSNFSRVASSHKNNNVLKARRGVVKMLIVVVLAFGLCNLPLHARKMWQYWSKDYKGDSNFYALFTPLTFLITYFNSGVNPLLYAFLSRNFRRGMSELLCSIKKGKSSSRLQRNRSHKNSLTTHTNTTFIQL